MPKLPVLNVTPEKWLFHCRLTDRHMCAIKPWLKKISKKGRARFDRAIEQLATQPRQNWSRPNASPIGNSVYVIRFADENRMQHRIFGHFSAKEASFIMTLDGYEKDATYYPTDYESKTEGYSGPQFQDSSLSCALS